MAMPSAPGFLLALLRKILVKFAKIGSTGSASFLSNHHIIVQFSFEVGCGFEG